MTRKTLIAVAAAMAMAPASTRVCALPCRWIPMSGRADKVYPAGVPIPAGMTCGQSCFLWQALRRGRKQMRKMLIAIAIAAALTGTAASARPPPWKQQGFASADACFKYADAHPSADGGRNCTFKDEIDFICAGARILAHLKECARHMDLCATLREYSKMAQTDRDEDY